MIKVQSIDIEQAEGDPRIFVVGSFHSISEANAALRKIRYQCGWPAGEPILGYLKTDVRILWEDGSVHKFRADVDYNGSDTDLTTMLRGWAERYTGPSVHARNLKRYMTPEQVQSAEEHARRLLAGELEIN